MIILNYHKVEDVEEAEFYTVSTSRFAQHLESIRRNRLRAISTEEMLETREESDVMMLHFDDGTADHFQNVAPQLNQRGMKGIFFVSTSKVGKSAYLSDVQLQILTRDGHCIECHGHTHQRMDQMSPEELEQEISTSVELIRLWTGRAPRILAPPGGFFNQSVVDAARRHGLDIVRTMRWGNVPLPVQGRMDCLVVTRFTSNKVIAMWLSGKGLRFTRFAYHAKQAIRSLLPMGIYVKVRKLLGLKGGKVALLISFTIGLGSMMTPMSRVNTDCILRFSRRTVDRPKEKRDLIHKYRWNNHATPHQC